MKPFILSALATGLLVGCASTDTTTVTHRSGSTVTSIDDQPQTAVAGEGSLMPGAYDTRSVPTGQFTGRERTNDQIGQRPTLPREADAGDLARSEDSLGVSGSGTLGQSGVVPNRAVTSETLMETDETVPPPAHVAVAPPASVTERERTPAEGVGAAPGISSGAASITNAPSSTGTNTAPVGILTNTPAAENILNAPTQPE
jgi:hypothetical protein